MKKKIKIKMPKFLKTYIKFFFSKSIIKLKLLYLEKIFLIYLFNYIKSNFININNKKIPI